MVAPLPSPQVGDGPVYVENLQGCQRTAFDQHALTSLSPLAQLGEQGSDRGVAVDERHQPGDQAAAGSAFRITDCAQDIAPDELPLGQYGRALYLDCGVQAWHRP